MDAINGKSMERIYLLKNIWCLSVCPRHNSWYHTSYNPKPSEKQFLTHAVIGSGVKGSHVWTLRFCGVFCYWSRHRFRVWERFPSYFCNRHLVMRVPVQQSTCSFYGQLIGYRMLKLQMVSTKIQLNSIQFVENDNC